MPTKKKRLHFFIFFLTSKLVQNKSHQYFDRILVYLSILKKWENSLKLVLGRVFKGEINEIIFCQNITKNKILNFELTFLLQNLVQKLFLRLFSDVLRIERYTKMQSKKCFLFFFYLFLHIREKERKKNENIKTG